MADPLPGTNFTVSVGSNTAQVHLQRHLAPLAVGAILRALPFKGNANRLGAKIIYVQSPAMAGLERPRTEFSAGDVAFLPSPGAVCFILSDVKTDKPMTPIGKITENILAFSDVKPGETISVYSATL